MLQTYTIEDPIESPPRPTSPDLTLQITGLSLILTKMSLKRQIEEDEKNLGQGKRMRLDFTRLEQTMEEGTTQGEKAREGPQIRVQKLKAEKTRRSVNKKTQ